MKDKITEEEFAKEFNLLRYNTSSMPFDFNVVISSLFQKQFIFTVVFLFLIFRYIKCANIRFKSLSKRAMLKEEFNEKYLKKIMRPLTIMTIVAIGINVISYYFNLPHIILPYNMTYILPIIISLLVYIGIVVMVYKLRKIMDLNARNLY